MKLLYKHEMILESDSKEELLDFKDKFIFEKEKKYTKILSKVNKLNKISMEVLNRNIDESDNAYLEKIKKTSPEFIELVEEVGKELFEEPIEYFYLNVPRNLFGVKIKEEYFTPMELSKKCLENLPKEKDFEIE